MRLDSTLRLAALTGVLAGALVAMPVPDATAAGRAGGSGPHLSGVTLSKTSLGQAGGTLRVTGRTDGASVCKLAVTPHVARKPAKKACDGGRVRWTVLIPRNRAATAVRYAFTLTARGAGGAEVARQRHLVQAASSAHPLISSFRPGRKSLEYVGGPLHLAADVRHVKRCRLMVDPATPSVTPHHACANGHQTWTLIVPENSTATALSYTIRLIAIGSHGRRATADVTVAQAAHPPPCPGQTSTATPITTAVFNDPSTGVAADQSRIVDAEINLICDAQLPVHGVRTQISMAQYIFTLDDVAQALVWAHRYMHADVKLVIDGSNEYMVNPDNSHVPNPAYDDVVANLPASSLVLCGPNAGTVGRPVAAGDEDDAAVFPAGTGCAGDNILHTKLLSVSAVDAAARPAVFISSQNFGLTSVVSAFNNGLQVVGDTALHSLTANYVKRIAGTHQQPDFGSQFGTALHHYGGAGLWTTISPRNSPAEFPSGKKQSAANDAVTDSWANILKAVNCTSPGKYAGSHSGPARTTIRIAMFVYRSRAAVTTTLDALADEGCNIRIVYSGINADELSDLRSHGITAFQVNTWSYQLPNGQTARIFVHDKYMLISGGLGATASVQRNQDLVLTGSPNLTEKALHHNDELGLAYLQTATAAARSTAIFRSYTKNWKELAAIARG